MKTSNPSSGEFQDQKIDGKPLYEMVGEHVAKWGADCMGDSYSYIGAVVGATYPEMGKVLRKVMPKSFILVPGYGAQGGTCQRPWHHILTKTDLARSSIPLVESLRLISSRRMHLSGKKVMQMHREQQPLQ